MESGLAKQNAESRAQESLKLGTLRAGSTGVVLPDGQISGICHRLSLARYLGNYTDADSSRALMFEAGRTNEDIWAQRLRDAGLVIKQEDEIPIRWELDGVVITGRPDIVIMDASDNNRPQLGLELKLVSSLWTGRDVLINRKPKFDHLCQAAHYGMQLGCDYELWYTSRSDYAVSGWAQRSFPTSDNCPDDIRDGIQFNESGGKENGKCKKLLPFMVGYRLVWVGDDLDVIDIQRGTRVQTPITRTAIANYYRYVLSLIEEKQLGNRPINLEFDGSLSDFKKCDYCDLAHICNTAETNYQKWVDLVMARSSIIGSTK
jgi:hypothetical protein